MKNLRTNDPRYETQRRVALICVTLGTIALAMNTGFFLGGFPGYPQALFPVNTAVLIMITVSSFAVGLRDSDAFRRAQILILIACASLVILTNGPGAVHGEIGILVFVFLAHHYRFLQRRIKSKIALTLLGIVGLKVASLFVAGSLPVPASSWYRLAVDLCLVAACSLFLWVIFYRKIMDHLVTRNQLARAMLHSAVRSASVPTVHDLDWLDDINLVVFYAEHLLRDIVAGHGPESKTTAKALYEAARVYRDRVQGLSKARGEALGCSAGNAAAASLNETVAATVRRLVEGGDEVIEVRLDDSDPRVRVSAEDISFALERIAGYCLSNRPRGKTVSGDDRLFVRVSHGRRSAVITVTAPLSSLRTSVVRAGSAGGDIPIENFLVGDHAELSMFHAATRILADRGEFSASCENGELNFMIRYPADSRPARSVASGPNS